MKIFLWVILFISNFMALADEKNLVLQKAFVRLDQIKTEQIKFYITHLYVTPNCSVCDEQILELQKCSSAQPFAVYLDGQEEKVRRYVQKKKWSHPVFLLDEELKILLGFLNVSPQISILISGQLKKLGAGLKKCSSLEEHLKKINSLN
jgi:hypothetical protein